MEKGKVMIEESLGAGKRKVCTWAENYAKPEPSTDEVLKKKIKLEETQVKEITEEADSTMKNGVSECRNIQLQTQTETTRTELEIVENIAGLEASLEAKNEIEGYISPSDLYDLVFENLTAFEMLLKLDLEYQQSGLYFFD